MPCSLIGQSPNITNQKSETFWLQIDINNYNINAKRGKGEKSSRHPFFVRYNENHAGCSYALCVSCDHFSLKPADYFLFYTTLKNLFEKENQTD